MKACKVSKPRLEHVERIQKNKSQWDIKKTECRLWCGICFVLATTMSEAQGVMASFFLWTKQLRFHQ